MKLRSVLALLTLTLSLAACSAGREVVPAAMMPADDDAQMRAAEAQLPAAERQEAAQAATIRTMGAPAKPSEKDLAPLRALIPQAEAAIGAKVTYKNDGELVPYLASLLHALPVSSYDRQGFLHDLGLEAPLSSGRQDDDTFAAVRQVKDYSVGVNIGDHELATQALAYKIAKASPAVYNTVAIGLNPLLEAYGRLHANWKKPFTPAQTAHPTGISPTSEYPGAYGSTAPTHGYRLLFDPDMHDGEPGTIPTDRKGSYGTYGIALRLGFPEDAARRIATTCNNIDEPGKTPYGRTDPLPMGGLDRHFNLDRHGQDTRYVWAQRHLEAAIAFGRQTSYTEAEIELGCGLHSLQDSFAHGQLTPCLHGTIGDYPDDVCYDPIAFLEASRATEAYLRRYLARIQ
jgi:hypothetical protein